MIVAICKVCKGPLAPTDLVTQYEGGLAHLSPVDCTWCAGEIAKADAEFLKTMKIAVPE